MSFIDVNSVPEDFDAQDFLDRWTLVNKAITVANPYVQGTNTTTTTGNGLWNQIRNGGNPYNSPVEDPWEKRLRLLEEEMAVVRTDLKLSRLKILALEGKFTQEEVINIRKMLMSKDEASITLADIMIENA